MRRIKLFKGSEQEALQKAITDWEDEMYAKCMGFGILSVSIADNSNSTGNGATNVAVVYRQTRS